MATSSDIDAVAAVRKYLEQELVSNREDETADPNDEITALLETLALSFLLYPQTVLSFVLRATNALQQVVAGELDLLAFIQDSLVDLGNLDLPITDTSDLVEAQSALVELDRLGRISQELAPYVRYTAAVQRFMSQQLALQLKRHNRQEFERTDAEAKQDLFQYFSAWRSVHSSMAQRLKDLAASVGDYLSVDLTRLVTPNIITRIRSVLQQLKEGLDQQQISKTVVAIELLSGAASLASISNIASVYDPAVKTGALPAGRIITAAAEQVAATATTSDGPWTFPGLPPWKIGLLLDGAAEVQATIPPVPFVLAPAPGQATYNIPVNSSLFVLYTDVGGTQMQEAALTAGVRSRADVISDINTGMGVHAVCTALNSTGPLLLSVAGITTGLQILEQGVGSYLGGVYQPPRDSAHAVLGFSARQQSLGPGEISVADLLTIAAIYWPTLGIVLSGAKIIFTSPTLGLGSSLQFTLLVGTLGLGLIPVLAVPTYLTLQEAGADVPPASLGVYIGSQLEVSGDRYLSDLVQDIKGNQLYFAGSLPRGVGLSVTATAPMVVVFQSLLKQLTSLTSSFDNDALRLQTVLAPLMGQSGLAQINDVKRQTNDLKGRLESLQSLLTAAVVAPDRRQFEDVAISMLNGLAERNLDRASDLLTRGLFSFFFSLTKDTTSAGARFLRSMEDVGREDLATPTTEENIQDKTDTPNNPNEKVFPSLDSSE